MRRARRSSGDAVTLFPFLAVLICTMGALIVLLVVLMLQAKASASDRSRQRAANQATSQAEAELVRLDVEESQWRIQMLQDSHSKTAEDLDLKRRELSYLEDEIRRIQQELDQAAAEAGHIEKLAKDQSQEDGVETQRIAALRADLKKAEKALEEARKERDRKKPSYAIVAYDGPNGTQRQPIYIECLEDRIVLQPEGVVMLSEDFEEPITDDNPLATALRAKREYLKDATGQTESLPYPLLIVRPKGAVSYAAARAAMKSWESEFGYELVEDELPLAFPEKDPTLSKLLESSVEEARARRRYLQAIAPARFGRRAPALLTASKSGGFVPADGSTPDRRSRPGYSAEEATRGMPGSGGAGNGQGGSGVVGNGVTGQPGGAGIGGYGTRTATVGRDLTAGMPPADWAGSSGNLNGPDGMGTGTASGDRLGGNAGNSGQQGSVGGNGNGGSGSGNGAQGSGKEGHGGPSVANGRDSSDGSSKGPEANRGTNGSRTGENGQGDSQVAGNGATSGSSASGSAANSAVHNPLRSGTTSGKASASGTAGGSSDAAGGGSVAAGGSGGGAASGSGGAGSGMPGFGMPSLSAGASGSDGSSTSRARGAEWGLPSRSAGATGLTRPIVVSCSDRQLMIYPERRDRNKKTTVIPLEGSMDQHADELVTKVWQRMESWGVAGQNMYWKPVLQVRVEKDGEARFEELSRLLENSGITVVRK